MPILEKSRLRDDLAALQLPKEGKQREVLALPLVTDGWVGMHKAAPGETETIH